MTGPTPLTLAEFLLQRIAEDAWFADQAAVPVWRYQLWNGTDRLIDPDDPDDPVVAEFNALDMDARHAGRWYPARVLAECEAKRRILALHMDTTSYLPSADRTGETCFRCERRWPCDELRLLALPYADHPGYREEWRP